MKEIKRAIILRARVILSIQRTPSWDRWFGGHGDPARGKPDRDRIVYAIFRCILQNCAQETQPTRVTCRQD